MKPPEIKERLGGYDFTWKEEKIQASVTKIKQHRDNRLTAWVIFTRTGTGNVGLIHQAELNFAASQSQTTLANTLNKKWEQAWWNEAVEQLRYYVLERVRTGDPVETISTASEFITPTTYLIHPLLPEHQPTIIFGEPGVGKSRIGNLIYTCLALPWFDNPLGLAVPDRKINTLILDWEADSNTTAWRIKALVEGMDLGMIDIHYKRGIGPLADNVEQIQLAIEEKQAQLIIVDSLAAACGGEVLKTEVAEEFFMAIRQLKVTSLIIAQTQKDPELRKKSILGSTLFEYYSRSVWEIKKAQTAGEDETHIALIHRKANESKLHKSLNYRFYFNGQHITVSTEKMQDVPEFNQNVPLQLRIRETLTRGPLTAKEIAENIDATAGTVSKTLSQMKKDGKVISLADNKWGLAVLP